MKMLPIVIITIAIIGIALYAFQAIQTISPRFLPSYVYNAVKYTFWLFHIVLIVGISYTFITMDRGSGSTDYMKWFGLFVLLIIPDLIIVTFLLLEDIYRGIHWVVLKINSSPSSVPDNSRRQFVSTAALALGAIPFASIAYGLMKGKYNYKVKKVALAFKDLPAAFDGLTITQISDLHTGSFDNAEKVAHGVQLINDLQSDVVVFTGDLVNNKAEEAKPWVDVFGKIKASKGKFSILGNHDYGDYVSWPTDESKKENLEQLKQYHADMGFKLLLNEQVELEKKGDKIHLAGVENWGKPPFVQYGDLNKALEQTDGFTVLLSHDPSHFDEQVKQHPKNVALTLSGHTHGMQFGIDLPGFKWSPVKFKYPKWSGLYEDLGKYLYVNQGFGYLAFPGRVGMWPEITQITLQKA